MYVLTACYLTIIRIIFSDSKLQIQMGYHPKCPTVDRSSIKVKGGPGRDHDVLMELQLTKVSLYNLQWIFT